MVLLIEKQKDLQKNILHLIATKADKVATFWGNILFIEMSLCNQIIGGVIFMCGICIYIKVKGRIEAFLKNIERKELLFFCCYSINL